MFCNFCEKFENSKWLPFLARQNFLKFGFTSLQRYSKIQKFRRNCSISHSFQDTSIFVFCNICKNSKILNCRHFWGDKNFFLIIEVTSLHRGLTTLQGYPMGKKFVEITLSHTVFKIQAFLYFAVFAKNSKILNGRHFWQDKLFFDILVNFSAEIPYG